MSQGTNECIADQRKPMSRSRRSSKIFSGSMEYKQESGGRSQGLVNDCNYLWERRRRGGEITEELSVGQSVSARLLQGGEGGGNPGL